MKAVPKTNCWAEWQVLVRTIEEKKAEVDRIEGDIAAAAGEDREALERRVAELAPDLFEDVQALAALVVAWGEQGQDTSAYRDQVADMLRRVASYIRRAVGRLDTEMDSLAARHQDAAPDEVVEIEDRHVVLDERLNYALSEFLAQLEAMDSFGLDTVADREFLESFFAGKGQRCWRDGSCSRGKTWPRWNDERVRARMTPGLLLSSISIGSGSMARSRTCPQPPE